MTKSIVKSDDYLVNISIILDRLMRRIPKKIVIHFDAHKVQEVPVYKQYGFCKILLLEANPFFEKNMEVSILILMLND
jgi:hypothetical protein